MTELQNEPCPAPATIEARLIGTADGMQALLAMIDTAARMPGPALSVKLAALPDPDPRRPATIDKTPRRRPAPPVTHNLVVTLRLATVPEPPPAGDDRQDTTATTGAAAMHNLVLFLRLATVPEPADTGADGAGLAATIDTAADASADGAGGMAPDAARSMTALLSATADGTAADMSPGA